MEVSRLGSLLGGRSSRRDAIKSTGAGLGAAAFGGSTFGRAAFAHDATPAAENHLGLPEGERTYTMFVQTARAGTWEAKPGEEGTYTLTLTGLPAQTVYFSDRPERIVGTTTTTTEFLSALGFSEENPPNAALVTKADDGQDDILVIELFNPVYTEGEGSEGATLVYEARILANYHETGLGRVALEQDDTSIPSSFEGASLFIDDCADGHLRCYRYDEYEGVGLTTDMGEQTFGCCYDHPGCHPCWDIPGICNSLPGCEDGFCYFERSSCRL